MSDSRMSTTNQKGRDLSSKNEKLAKMREDAKISLHREATRGVLANSQQD